MAVERALFFVEPRKVEVREVPAREPHDGEVVAHALASGVSPGTELLLYRGEGPTPFDPSLGTTTYPCRYGYAWVGETSAGTRVFALATHGDRHCLFPGHYHELPKHIPATRAVLAANLETALTCAWDSEVVFGDRAVVFGAGVVGTLTAWILMLSGAKVTVIEPREGRRACARELLGSGVNVIATTETAQADVVIEATGRPETLDAAIRVATSGARVVVASFYGQRRAAVDLGDAFHRRRLTLVASQVSALPPRIAARFDVDRRFATVIELLGQPALDALVGAPTPFERAPQLYEALDRDPAGLPCPVFVYR